MTTQWVPVHPAAPSSPLSNAVVGSAVVGVAVVGNSQITSTVTWVRITPQS